MVLVTGGTGFIGKILIRNLINSGVDLRLLSRRKVNGLETVICDFQYDQIPKNSFQDIDTVFHLAGFAHDFREASKVESIYQVINVETTVKLAELSVKNKVKKFIFVSSVKAGGSAIKGGCSSEDDQREPEGIYGKTKRDAELKILDIGRKSNMHVSIVRPSLVYGPEVKGNLRKMYLGIEKGWFPPLPETGDRRSMIHVDDLVQALLLVAEDERANCEIFIATDGEPHSSREIYEAMCAVLDKSVPRWSLPKSLFDIVAAMIPAMRYKVNKLLGDECYSSTKLETLGFKVQKTLKDMNETSF